jgi:hypothetical protein
VQLVWTGANNIVIEGATIDNGPIAPTQPFISANYGIGVIMSGACSTVSKSHIFNVRSGAEPSFITDYKFEDNEIAPANTSSCRARHRRRFRFRPLRAAPQLFRPAS